MQWPERLRSFWSFGRASQAVLGGWCIGGDWSKAWIINDIFETRTKIDIFIGEMAEKVQMEK